MEEAKLHGSMPVRFYQLGLSVGALPRKGILMESLL